MQQKGIKERFAQNAKAQKQRIMAPIGVVTDATMNGDTILTMKSMSVQRSSLSVYQ